MAKISESSKIKLDVTDEILYNCAEEYSSALKKCGYSVQEGDESTEFKVEGPAGAMAQFKGIASVTKSKKGDSLELTLDGDTAPTTIFYIALAICIFFLFFCIGLIALIIVLFLFFGAAKKVKAAFEEAESKVRKELE